MILNRPVPPASDSVPMDASRVLQQGASGGGPGGGARGGGMLLQTPRSVPPGVKVVEGVAGKLVQMTNKLFNPETQGMEYQSAAKPTANAASAVSRRVGEGKVYQRFDDSGKKRNSSV